MNPKQLPYPFALPATLLALSLAPCLVLGGCAKNSEGDAETEAIQRQIQKQFPVNFDQQLSPAELAAVVRDFKAILDSSVNAASGSLFESAFGGTRVDAVVQYMGERVHYILAPDLPISARIEMGATAPEPSPSPSSPQDPQKRGIVLATNVGTVVWMIQEAHPEESLFLRFNSERVHFETSRVGLIQLGKSYASAALTSLERATVLVHEGRHSDCTGGLMQSDLAKIRAGEYPASNLCGHRHVACPAGHALEGLPACDEHPWGAYSIEAIYASAIEKTCDKCTSEQRELAAVAKLDALSRILVLEPMLKGELGLPDMSSSGVLNR